MQLAPLTGKTTVIRAVVAGFPCRAGGFITEADLGTILRAAHPWTDAFKRRPMVELYRLTERNREDLEEALLARLRTEVRG